MCVKDVGNLQVPTLESSEVGASNQKYLEGVIDVSSRLADVTAKAVSRGAVPLVLGGDHSLSIGSVSGYAASAPREFCLIWLDAHPDCNTPETTMSGNIHGMSLAVLLGKGDVSLVNCHQPGVKCEPDSVALVGIADIDSAEERLIDDMQLRAYAMDDIIAGGISAVLDGLEQQVGDRDLYVSLDMDVIESVSAPGVGLRSSTGLTYREIKYLCKNIGSRFHVVGMDVVELNPIFDHENQTAELAVELIMALLGHEYGAYQQYVRAHGI
jgi:arginase